MDDFIFTKKSKSHVIDLEKTLNQLEKARKLIIEIISNGGQCIMVGTNYRHLLQFKKKLSEVKVFM